MTIGNVSAIKARPPCRSPSAQGENALKRIMVTLAAVALVGFAVQPTASAATPSAGRSVDTQATVTQSMTETSIVRTLSTTGAWTTVQLSNGGHLKMKSSDVSRARSASAKAATSPLLHPQTTVTGNCGSSYITLSEHNGWPVHMDTGFHVIHDAISYNWEAEIGNAKDTYLYYYQASGDLDFDSTWHGQHSSHTAYGRGTYYAFVFQPSYAVLWDGDVCVSGDPYTTKYL